MPKRMNFLKLFTSKYVFIGYYLFALAHIFREADHLSHSWMTIVADSVFTAAIALLLYNVFDYLRRRTWVYSSSQAVRVGSSARTRAVFWQAFNIILSKKPEDYRYTKAELLDALYFELQKKSFVLNKELYAGNNFNIMFTDSPAEQGMLGATRDVHHFYIDYKILSAADFSALLSVYSKLFKSFYLVYDFNTNELEYETEQLYHLLQIDSAHTGNSINIKTKVGWMPTFKHINGNTEVEIPRGLVPFLIVGYLLTYISSNGLGMYKQWLEADILEVELEQKTAELEGYGLDLEGKRLANEKTRYEILELKTRLKKQSPEEKQMIQNQLDSLYTLSSGNKNFNKVVFKQE